uniref:CCHC-type domain-containing protein n=1 Tax=Cajanus cajan TaxID=3821 RepID=A0A151QUH1_CAJCA|nr:hypothetical protein KK1_045179 [Cajanus cajan]
MQFLRCLNDQYGNIHSHVLLMDPLPPITKIFSYVSQQERQLSVNETFVATVNMETHSPFVNSAGLNCNFCGRTGHAENTCFCKHGFPSEVKNNKNTYARGKTCTHCGKGGHTIDVCYRKHGFPPGHRFHNGKFMPTATVMTSDTKVSENEQQSTANEVQDIRFSPHQYQALLH